MRLCVKESEQVKLTRIGVQVPPTKKAPGEGVAFIPATNDEEGVAFEGGADGERHRVDDLFGQGADEGGGLFGVAAVTKDDAQGGADAEDFPERVGDAGVILAIFEFKDGDGKGPNLGICGGKRGDIQGEVFFPRFGQVGEGVAFGGGEPPHVLARGDGDASEGLCPIAKTALERGFPEEHGVFVVLEAGEEGGFPG